MELGIIRDTKRLGTGKIIDGQLIIKSEMIRIISISPSHSLSQSIKTTASVYKSHFIPANSINS